MLVLTKQALLFLGPLPKLQPLELPDTLEQTNATMIRWLGPGSGPLQKSSWSEPGVGWPWMFLSTPGSGTGVSRCWPGLFSREGEGRPRRPLLISGERFSCQILQESRVGGQREEEEKRQECEESSFIEDSHSLAAPEERLHNLCLSAIE